MSEMEKELKQLRQTVLQKVQELDQVMGELENVQKSMGNLVEQTLASVALNKFQSEQIEKLKAEIEQLKGDDMADELNAAEADRYVAHALGEIAQFVETVREMRAAQCEYFRTRDKAVMKKSMALEKQVDEAIKKDDYVLWALQYLPKED